MKLSLLLCVVVVCLGLTHCGGSGSAAGPSTAGGGPGPVVTPVPVVSGNPCSSTYPSLFGGSGNSASANCTLLVSGATRGYRLHVPLNFQAGTSALVVVLHGSRATGTGMENTSQLSLKSDQVGFAVAYPNALANPSGATTWNGFYNFTFGSNPPDDSGLLRQVITTLQTDLRFDPKRVYVVGFSSGGFMAHRAGVDLSDIVAAIGVVEGSLSSIATTDTRQVPAPLGPVAVLMLHGSSDTTLPYCGGGTSSFTDASQEQTFNFWSSHDSCGTVNTSSPLCDASGNITAVTAKQANSCSAGTQVQFYKLIGGSHTYYLSPMNNPSGTPYNPNFDTTTGVTTNDILWNFFVTHPKP